MCSSDLKLRLQDTATERPYRVPGGQFSVWYCGIVPSVILILGILFFFYVPGFDFDPDYLRNVGGGILIALVIGEILIFKAKRSRTAEE